MSAKKIDLNQKILFVHADFSKVSPFRENLVIEVVEHATINSIRFQ